ncbi:ferredoxin [Rhodococcus sp. USK13]|uniref:ferredoxin n=1 Tax=Rhodococcus sp. USK13 TaxID=2806442 RepID=UPI001BCB0544|nr:ferredoxin [Rhodococcus sp. USK13]
MKSRVFVDASKCQLYGICVVTQPDVFDIPTDNSALTILRATVGDDEIDDVEDAVRSCPAQALSLKRVET